MKQRITLLTAFLFTLSINAQISNDSKNTPTPSRIKVYTPSSSFSSKTNDKKDNSYKWTAKTDIVAMATGEFPLIAEYRIAEKFSVEGSAAVTYTFIPNDGLFANDGFGLLDDTGKAAIGNAFRASIKYYPSADFDALEGWYFGFQLYTKTTNRTYEESGLNSSSQATTMYTDSKTKNGISLIIGRQIFADSNVSTEIFFGVGLANIIRDQPVVATNDNTGATTIQMQNSSETQPNFQFGTRIGFGN